MTVAATGRARADAPDGGGDVSAGLAVWTARPVEEESLVVRRFDPAKETAFVFAIDGEVSRVDRAKEHGEVAPRAAQRVLPYPASRRTGRLVAGYGPAAGAEHAVKGLLDVEGGPAGAGEAVESRHDPLVWDIAEPVDAGAEVFG
jgi:hypothetical protein